MGGLEEAVLPRICMKNLSEIHTHILLSVYDFYGDDDWRQCSSVPRHYYFWGVLFLQSRSNIVHTYIHQHEGTTFTRLS